MKLIKHALLGLLLSASALGASAAVISGTDVATADMSNPGLLQTWNFSIGGAGVMANDTFNYDILFFPPPSDPTTYFAFLANGGDQNQVSFTAAAFTSYFGPPPPDFTTVLGSQTVYGSGPIDSAGIYDLHLEGVFLADDAAVNGLAANDINPVSLPEPVSVSLMLAGLAGMARTRRRGAKTAQPAVQAA